MFLPYFKSLAIICFTLYYLNICGFTSDTIATDNLSVYSFPKMCPKASNIKVFGNGKEIFIYQTEAGAFASFECNGSVEMEIELNNPVKSTKIAPKRYGISAEIDGNRVKFRLDNSANLLIEIENMEPFFLFANSPILNIPTPNKEGVYYFKSGQIYEVGLLRLKSNETLYIEGGAVVQGCIRATNAENVRITGNGILDGGYYASSSDKKRTIVLEGCKNSKIENITIINPSTWMIVLGASENIIIENIKELGFVSSSDGLDIVGSKNIQVKNCFFRNGDDCIAIKSLDLREHDKTITLDFTKDVENIEISRCSFLAYRGGQAMEIGHELRTNTVKNIRFSDCDVLGVHGFAAPFSIHNADRTTVSNITYENIRVEHHFDKLIDLRIFESRWSKDQLRGKVKNILFKNIDVTISLYNPGYSSSIIGGFDNLHQIEGVVFDNFKYNGKKVTSADELNLFTKQVKNIVFK